VSINIGHTLAQSAQELTDKPGLVEGKTGKVLSFTELNQRADTFAHILTDGGVRPGRKVMLMVKPSADFICLTFALFKIGAPVILIDPGMGYKNLLSCIKGVAPEYFIGIPKAHLFRLLFPKVFSSIKTRFCCGNSFKIFGRDICKDANVSKGTFTAYDAEPQDLAAIIFTTGSTGPPKGVRYEHSIFYAQLKLIRDYYKIDSSQTDQPAFPLFALFSISLGAKSVIPDMDPTRPAKVDPERFVASISKHRVTYSFGSPAIWNVIAGYCEKRDSRIQTLKKVLMAGAPVSGDLLARMYRILPADAEIHTPYGATESLPIVSIEGREVVEETWEQTRKGKGTCVGRSLPNIEIAIIPISDKKIETLDGVPFLDANEIGEIIVRGDVVTRAYDNNKEETNMAKIYDGNSFWHRMGDVGYLDMQNRLWFCGRRAHRVVAEKSGKTYFSIPCEAIVNVHPNVFRSALVAVYFSVVQDYVPILIVEPAKGSVTNDEQLLTEVRKLANNSPLTSDIQYFLIHPDFPVDIRHNAKIFREKLAVWAAEQLKE